jgi:GNAT superfamily N-acetyltransferase
LPSQKYFGLFFFLLKNIKKQKTMLIRKGIPEDMKSVLELIKELAVFEKEPDAVVVTEKDLVRDGFGENPLFHVFVAEVETQIVGIALYYYRYSTWKGRTIHLEDLIVKSNQRGSGIGFALYSEIMAQAKRDGVLRVDWNVLDWNQPAIDFYEKSGAKVLPDWSVVQMDKKGLEKFLTPTLSEGEGDSNK